MGAGRVKPGRVRLLPGALLSLPVFGISLLWAFLVQLVEWAGLGETIGTLGVRLASAFAVNVLMFAFPYLTWRAICPYVPSRHWTWLLMTTLLLGATVRGVALGILLFRLGVAGSPEYVFRIVASLTHMALVVVLLWFLVSEVRELHARRRLLLAERDRLLALQDAARSDLDRLNDRATEEIRESILDSLGGLAATDSAEFRERLRVTIDDVVRPLSHRLAAQPAAWAPPPATDEATGADWPQAAREGLDPALIHPVILPIALIYLGLPIHLFRFGLAITAVFVALLAITIPAFWLARQIAIRLTDGRSVGAKAVGFVAAVLSGALVLGLATLPYMQGEPQPFLFVIAGPVLALLISTPLAIAETARDQDLELEAELRATTADLRWALVRARERYRQQEGALAHALHGRLQASLAAAFLRLDRAVLHGSDDDVLVAALQADVRVAVESLDVIDSEPEPLDKLIALTQSNWSGAAQINVTVDPQARAALSDDPLCARSVNDLIPELVFNSIRHGGATSIDVRIETADARTLSLSVVDDGGGDLEPARYGLGSTLLDEASISWTRHRTDAGTTTTCLLPVLTTASALVAT